MPRWSVGGDSPETVPLIAVDNQPGVYEAGLIARKTGKHSVRISIPASEAEAGVIEADSPSSCPASRPTRSGSNTPLLKELATLSGGKYFDIDQLDELAAAVPDKTETAVIRSKPDPLWDVRGMLVVLVGLLGCEWFLRKRFKLL